jgi:hypothetical protein
MGDGLVIETQRLTKRYGARIVVHRHQPDDSWLRTVEIFNWTAPLA